MALHISSSFQVLAFTFLHAEPKFQAEIKLFPLPVVLGHGVDPSGRHSKDTDLFSCFTDDIIAKLSEWFLTIFCLLDERFMSLDHETRNSSSKDIHHICNRYEMAKL